MTPDTQLPHGGTAPGNLPDARPMPRGAAVPGAHRAAPGGHRRVPASARASLGAQKLPRAAGASGAHEQTFTTRGERATAAGRSARAREDVKIVKVVPLLAVMVVTVAGIYVAWQKGSAGGGEGGVIAGVALLAAAAARLLLPASLVGLLAMRKRALDVITLAAFGTCLLVAGLVLPR